jgi:hypothetical protein
MISSQKVQHDLGIFLRRLLEHHAWRADHFNARSGQMRGPA